MKDLRPVRGLELRQALACGEAKHPWNDLLDPDILTHDFALPSTMMGQGDRWLLIQFDAFHVVFMNWGPRTHRSVNARVRLRYFCRASRTQNGSVESNRGLRSEGLVLEMRMSRMSQSFSCSTVYVSM